MGIALLLPFEQVTRSHLLAQALALVVVALVPVDGALQRMKQQCEYTHVLQQRNRWINWGIRWKTDSVAVVEFAELGGGRSVKGGRRRPPMVDR